MKAFGGSTEKAVTCFQLHLEPPPDADHNAQLWALEMLQIEGCPEELEAFVQRVISFLTGPAVTAVRSS